MLDSKAMLALTLFLPFITGVIAGPLDESFSRHNQRLQTRGASSPHDACEAAENCETYTDDTGRSRIRFKKGMEPGSEDYNRRMAKRDSNPTSQVTIGDNKIAWGCGNDPVQVLSNLQAPCMTSGSCDTTQPYTTTIQYLDVIGGSNAGPPVSEPLTLGGSGQYPSWMRNGLVEAIQAAASSNGVVQWNKGFRWFAGPGKAKRDTAPSSLQDVGGSAAGPSTGTCDVAVFSTYVSVNVYSSPNTLEGFMEADISLGNGNSNGFCGDLEGLNLVQAVSSAFGAWGAGIAAILGSVSAICNG